MGFYRIKLDCHGKTVNVIEVVGWNQNEVIFDVRSKAEIYQQTEEFYDITAFGNANNSEVWQAEDIVRRIHELHRR